MALARLPASFSAVGLYVAVVAAAGYAWLLLGERLSAVQVVGGVVVLAAIALARNARRPAAAAPEAALPEPAAPEPQRASIQSSTPRHSESR